MGTLHLLDQGLTGNHVLIFGGTSGIGLSTAIQARKLGAKVTVIGPSADKARSVAEVHAFSGWRAADVTVQREIELALHEVQRVDHLVLVAGAFVARSVIDTDMEHLHRAFDERI